MLETVILVNLALCFLFGTVLLNRKYDLGVIYGRESKSFVIVILVLFAFTLNMMPLVSAADSDGDGVEDDDACPFDPNDECLGTQEEENFPEDVPGCVHESAENYNSDATEDDGSCTYEADSPGLGLLLSILSCIIVTFRRKL